MYYIIYILYLRERSDKYLASPPGLKTLRGYMTLCKILDMKICRYNLATSAQCVMLFERSLKEFLRRLAAINEAWVHCYTAKIKEQSK